MTEFRDRVALVAGAGGFIGGHLVQELLSRGYGQVRCVDVKPQGEWWQVHPDTEVAVLDLKDLESCRHSVMGVTDVFNLACDMGGIGFIENNKAACMMSVLINTHLLQAAQEEGVQRYFYSSSACVYSGAKQRDAEVTALKEADAYPAEPEDGYGWEKLFSERMCRHFAEDFGMHIRVARFHNVYGPNGTWTGGREKAPAAMCRKIVEAKLSGDHRLEIWGDGEQTRSFMYVDDCVEGILRLHESTVDEPINLGSDELVTINGLADIVAAIAGVDLEREYLLDAPKGVRGRNSDNTMITERLGWAPSISLRDGLRLTYAWVLGEIQESFGAPLASSPTQESSPCPESSSSTSTTGQTSPAPDSI